MQTPHSHRRIGLALCAALLLAGFAGLSGTALATTDSGIKGKPQPELAPFVVGTASGSSSVSTDGYNSNLVVAYEVATHKGGDAVQVCVLKRGARSCASKTTLRTEKGSSIYGTPFVTVENSGDVFVAMDECCNANDLLFESTDGGKTFGAPVPLGTADGPNIAAAEAFGVTGEPGHIIWAQDDAGRRFYVEYAPFNDPADGLVVTAMKDAKNAAFYTAGLGSHAGGVLAAASDSNDATIVSFAPAYSTTFHRVGRFANQTLISMSGDALVTQRTTGKQPLVFRLFNGTSFGPAYNVPDSGGGGPHWDIAHEASGRTFVFTERFQDSYDLEMQSTTTGASWSGRTNLGSAIKSNGFSAALDNIGSGVVVGTSGPVTVFPVLARQPVTFTLSKNKVGTGTGVTASGVGSSPEAGRTVQLQALAGGSWHNTASTTEDAKGDFSFKIAGRSVGRYTFRVRANLLPGYLQYGYSASQTLKVVHPKS